MASMFDNFNKRFTGKECLIALTNENMGEKSKIKDLFCDIIKFIKPTLKKIAKKFCGSQ